MTVAQKIPRLSLFPPAAGVNKKGHLVISGCDTVELAEKFGTPLYVFDEAALRGKCAEFKTEFSKRYPDTLVIYASKACSISALMLIMKEEELGLDVVSGGEMNIAHSVDFPMDKVYFHGNNKSAEELRLALKWRVGRIVVDNFHELDMLNQIAREVSRVPEILLRLTPGIDPHTHKYNTTGITDSKFGFPRFSWDEAVGKALSASHLKLIGLHFHLGSGIFEIEPYPEGTKLVLDFAASVKPKYNFRLRELDIGGGFAAQYVLDTPTPPVSAYAEAITSAIISRCRELKLEPPRLIIEPGRSTVARACAALYTVGMVKDIPGVRCYVSVDGGMGDNIRHALYGARHEALLSNKVLEKEDRTVTIAGKFCESGDILIRDIALPPVAAGDILAVADCGAYCIPMSSNYNAVPRPAVVMVKDGTARLIRRRETYEDLTRCDIV